MQEQPRSDDESLYDAVLQEFAAQQIEVDLNDRDRGLISSSWKSLNAEVRHRWIARVIRSHAGLVLTVDSTYERRRRVGRDVVWEAADDPTTLADKRRDEQRLGTAIQERFRKMR